MVKLIGFIKLTERRLGISDGVPDRGSERGIDHSVELVDRLTNGEAITNICWNKTKATN